MESKDRPVRVGVYGTGSWANRTHIPNLLELDGVELVALCDIDAEARAATADKFGIPVCPHGGGIGLCNMIVHYAL